MLNCILIKWLKWFVLLKIVKQMDYITYLILKLYICYNNDDIVYVKIYIFNIQYIWTRSDSRISAHDPKWVCSRSFCFDFWQSMKVFVLCEISVVVVNSRNLIQSLYWGRKNLNNVIKFLYSLHNAAKLLCAFHICWWFVHWPHSKKPPGSIPRHCGTLIKKLKHAQ